MATLGPSPRRSTTASTSVASKRSPRHGQDGSNELPGSKDVPGAFWMWRVGGLWWVGLVGFLMFFCLGGVFVCGLYMWLWGGHRFFLASKCRLMMVDLLVLILT